MNGYEIGKGLNMTAGTEKANMADIQFLARIPVTAQAGISLANLILLLNIQSFCTVSWRSVSMPSRKVNLSL
jgi:hypothetical protein